MRITKMWPTTDWNTVWRNIHLEHRVEEHSLGTPCERTFTWNTVWRNIHLEHRVEEHSLGTPCGGTFTWNTVWRNIHCTPVPGGTKAAWYKVIHDILPTNVRLYKIRMFPADKCSNCGMHDTLLHRLIECGEGPQIWQWTTRKLALILRTIPTRIPSEWLLRPQRALWPPTRRRAVMWILANIVLFGTRPNQEVTVRDFIAFMQANKYKLYQTVKRRLLVANYPCVLDMP